MTHLIVAHLPCPTCAAPVMHSWDTMHQASPLPSRCDACGTDTTGMIRRLPSSGTCGHVEVTGGTLAEWGTIHESIALIVGMPDAVPPTPDAPVLGIIARRAPLRRSYL